MDAVPHVHSRRRIGAEEPHRLFHRLRVRLGVANLVCADQHIHGVVKPHQPQPPQGALPGLAGDEAGLESPRPDAAHHLDHAGKLPHHPVMVREVVFAVGADHGFHRSLIVLPRRELRAQWRTDASQPLVVAERGEAVGGKCVPVALEDELHRVDQRAVEIE